MPLKMRNKTIFIDRDGTINVDKGYVHKIEDFEFIPGSLEALQLLTEHDATIYIVTNQAGIAKGYFTPEDFAHLTEYMVDCFTQNNIKIKKVLYCPHHPQGKIPQYSIPCNCRKPENTLLKRIIEEQTLYIPDLSLIGDKNSDIEAGRSLGIKTYLVETGYGKSEKLATNADFIVTDLKSAVLNLLGIKC